MNELGLPPTRQLPAEVRERALHTVLSGMDSPQRRRLAPLLTTAAAVAAAVTVTTMVAVSAPGPGSPGAEAPGLEQLASGPPVMSGDPLTDNALTRCADAVVARNRTADYPPTSEWRTTEVLLTSPGGDTAIAINDRFACFVGMSNVYVSSTRGRQAGPVAIAQLTPAIVVVLNPERHELDIVPRAAFIDPGGAPDAPVQLMMFGSASAPTSNLWLTVPGSYDGLMPDPGPVGVVVEDHRPMPTTTAEPPGPR